MTLYNAEYLVLAAIGAEQYWYFMPTKLCKCIICMQQCRHLTNMFILCTVLYLATCIHID